MLQILVALSLMTPPPDTAKLVYQLGDPAFKVREAASKKLGERMTYTVAVCLENAKPRNAEAKTRIERLVRGYWAEGYFGTGGFDDVPCFDALNLGSRPLMVDDRLTRYYYTRREVWVAVYSRNDNCPWSYKAATMEFLADLRRWHIPPAVVRPILAAMRKRDRQVTPYTSGP